MLTLFIVTELTYNLHYFHFNLNRIKINLKK